MSARRREWRAACRAIAAPFEKPARTTRRPIAFCAPISARDDRARRVQRRGRLVARQVLVRVLAVSHLLEVEPRARAAAVEPADRDRVEGWRAARKPAPPGSLSREPALKPPSYSPTRQRAVAGAESRRSRTTSCTARGRGARSPRAAGRRTRRRRGRRRVAGGAQPRAGDSKFAAAARGFGMWMRESRSNQRRGTPRRSSSATRASESRRLSDEGVGCRDRGEGIFACGVVGEAVIVQVGARSCQMGRRSPRTRGRR